MSLIEDLSAVLTIAEQPLSRLDVLTEHIPVDGQLSQQKLLKNHYA